MMKMKKKCEFHEKLFPFKGFYCTKSFQNPLVLCSKPSDKSKKFPYKGVFPFEGFPFNEYELYLENDIQHAQFFHRSCLFFLIF